MISTVTEKRFVSTDTVIMKFSTDEIFTFIPGQFVMLTIKLRNQGKFRIKEGKKDIQKRAFSIASSPTLGTQEYELIITHEENGFVSDFLVNIVDVGEKIETTGPYGKFVFEESVTHAVLIASGSGIAPMRSIINFVHDTGKDIPIELFYSNKTVETIACREEIEHYGQWGQMKIYQTITRPHLSSLPWEGQTGRLTLETIKNNSNLTNATIYICGSVAMAKSLKQQLLDDGIAKEKIKMEAWG